MVGLTGLAFVDLGQNVREGVDQSHLATDFDVLVVGLDALRTHRQ